MNNHILNITNGSFAYSNKYILTLKKLRLEKSTPFSISDLNLSLDKKKVYGLIGKNGSGKTTLLKILFSKIELQGGSFSKSFNTSKLVSNSLKTYNTFNSYEIFKLYYLLEKLTFDSKDFETKINSFIELTEFSNQDLLKPISNLSKGMKSKVVFSAIYTLLDKNVNFLGFDEFFTFGDQYFRKKSESLMLNLLNDESTVVISSHNFNLLRNICNEVILIDSGNIVDIGKPENIINLYRKGIS